MPGLFHRVRREFDFFRPAAAFAALGFLDGAALAQDMPDDGIAGVGDAVDAAELIPSATAGLPPVLPGQEAGARSRASGDAPGDTPDESWSTLTGGWLGARRRLAELGIEANGSAILEWSGLLDGGVREGSAFRFLVDLNATLDLEVIAGIDGASAFIDFQTADAPVDGLDTGAFQAYSNIAIDGSITQLSQLWYEQWLFDRAVRIKLGKIDANSEFAYLGAAGGFIDASAGFSPAIVALPTYPNPATSVHAFIYPDESVYLGAALYDGAATVDGVPTGSRGPATFLGDDGSDDWFAIAELGITLAAAGPFAQARAGLGAWWHSGEFARFDGGTEDGTSGLYAVAEGRVWNPEGVDPADGDDQRGLWVFAQFGCADGEVSVVERQLGLGASLAGTFGDRDEDSCGVYLTRVDFTDAPAAALGSDEWAIEFFYDFAVAPCVSLKPDIQWIRNAGGGDDDAFVASLRVTVSF